MAQTSTDSGSLATVGDGLVPHNGLQFSTLDRDNDSHGAAHCAQWFPGGWWFQGCHYSQLNGIYPNIPQTDHGMNIQLFPYKRHNYSFKGASMSIL